MRNQLQAARNAIEAGDLRQAQMMASEVLKHSPDNAEAWFLLSEATDGERKLIFLRKALELKPEYAEAQQRLARLEGRAVPSSDSDAEEDEEYDAEYDDDFEDEDDDFEDEDDEELEDEDDEPLPWERAANYAVVDRDDEDDEALDDDLGDEYEDILSGSAQADVEPWEDQAEVAQLETALEQKVRRRRAEKPAAEGTSRGLGLDVNILLMAVVALLTLFALVRFLQALAALF